LGGFVFFHFCCMARELDIVAIPLEGDGPTLRPCGEGWCLVTWFGCVV
jgi:hypothetical protein